MQPNAGVGWLLRKTTPAPIYGTRAFAGARTDRLGVASKRQHHPSKPTNPPSRTIVSLVPLPTSGEPPLTTAVEPSQFSSVDDGSCPFLTLPRFTGQRITISRTD